MPSRVGRGKSTMDFYALLDQVVDLLRSRQRVTYRMLKRQFDLDDTALEDLKEALLFAHPQIADEEGRGLVWTPDPAPVSCSRSIHSRRGDPPGTSAPLLHPPTPRREDSDLPQCAGRRAQTRDSALCRSQRLPGAHGRPRPGGGAPAPRSGTGAYDGGRAPLRRDRQPGHGRWDYGLVWGTDCA